MTLSSVLATFRRRWRFVIAGLLVAVLGGAVFLWQATPMYRSSAAFFVSSMGDTENDSAYTDSLFSQTRVGSYLQVLTGEQLAATVIDDLDLDMTPAQLVARTTAAVSPQTVVLDVSVVDESPERARDVLVALSGAFAARVEQLETPEGSDWSPVRVTQIADPQVSTTPVTPDIPLVVGLALGLGVLLGLAGAVVRERLDDTVLGEGDVASALGSTAVLGAVPRWDGTSGPPTGEMGALASEAYRTVRTNLQFVDVDAQPRVIVVTSSHSGEGKTTTSVQLASVLAQAGKRVVLVDGDLRRPQVAATLSLVGDVGLSNVLAGTAGLSEVLQYSAVPGLTVIASGPTAPYPSELLGSRQMAGLLVRLREEYDHVVIDAPPVLPVTDAAVLAVQADGCVLVSRHGTTRRTDLRQAGQALALVEARVLGVVLNAVPTRELPGHYGYGGYPEQGLPASHRAVLPVTALRRPAAPTPAEAPAPEAPTGSRIAVSALAARAAASSAPVVEGRHRAFAETEDEEPIEDLSQHRDDAAAVDSAAGDEPAPTAAEESVPAPVAGPPAGDDAPAEVSGPALTAHAPEGVTREPSGVEVSAVVDEPAVLEEVTDEAVDDEVDDTGTQDTPGAGVLDPSRKRKRSRGGVPAERPAREAVGAGRR